MKIALLLSGEIRDYKKCYKNIFEFIGNHDCDTFIVTWDKIGGSIHSGNKTFNNQNIDIDDIKNKFKPKKIKILSKEKWNNYTSKILNVNNNIHQRETGVFIQYYLWLLTFLEFKKYKIENNLNYDIIIRTRPDIYLINKNVDFNALNLNLVYSSYENCKKHVAIPKSDPIMKIVAEKYLKIHSNFEKNNISTDLLKKLDLYEYIDFINFDILKIKSDINYIINTPFMELIDWFNISNYNNIEIISTTFIFYLLFLENNNATFLKNSPTNRCNILFYNIWLNGIKTNIFPSRFSNIVFNNRQYLTNI